MNRKEYEDDLKIRQKQHLDSVSGLKDAAWRPCLHDSCTQCVGTGVRKDGSSCIHFISCPCPKCSGSFCSSIQGSINGSSVHIEIEGSTAKTT